MLPILWQCHLCLYATAPVWCLQWLSIARELGAGRLAGECLARYEQHLRPASNRPWSEAEDEQLLAAFRRHGRNWKVQSSFKPAVPRVSCCMQSQTLRHNFPGHQNVQWILKL